MIRGVVMQSADGREQRIGGRYALIAPVGEGGLGTVWEARDVLLDRVVALKITRPDVDLVPAQLARIEREARVAAAIDHENIVRVFDYGVDELVGPFIVMELLRGRTLEDELIAHGTLRLRTLIAWLEPIARALDAIHARGLAHRDVKPANIMRAEHGDAAVVKLLDFGIAAYLDGRERLTRRGLVIGTPEYMAPEVAEGALPTSASDVYSLAVIAFEALSGKLPHEGDTQMAQLAAKTTRRAASLAETTGRIFTLRVEEAFAHALETDPALRTSSATELVRALAACVR
jgi:serine/threonine-protein kinase